MSFEFLDQKKNKIQNEVPVLSYGLDLKYWGENDIKPAEVPRNNADCHRFWRPSDEGLVQHDCLRSYSSILILYDSIVRFVAAVQQIWIS